MCGNVKDNERRPCKWCKKVTRMFVIPLNYNETNPPPAPPACAFAPMACIFSPTFLFTSKNFATQRSTQTLSPLLSSGSAYLVPMHFVWHDLKYESAVCSEIVIYSYERDESVKHVRDHVEPTVRTASATTPQHKNWINVLCCCHFNPLRVNSTLRLRLTPSKKRHI